MNTSGLLEQLLGGALSSGHRSNPAPHSNANSNVNSDPASGLGSLLSGLGSAKGGLAAGALGMLLGNRSGRGLGGLAALGSLAFQAYSAWQARPVASQAANALFTEPHESTSHAVLAAVIAAAKADGAIDATEQQHLDAHLTALATDAETAQWVRDEIARPLDIAEVASLATSPAIAAQMYAASVMLIDDINTAERSYLDQLADALHLPSDLCDRLQAQVQQA